MVFFRFKIASPASKCREWTLGEEWKQEDLLGVTAVVWGSNGGGLDTGDASRVSDKFWEQSRELAYHNMAMSELSE